MGTTQHFGVLIIGAGTAGITVSARLKHAGFNSVGLLDPAEIHHYQPLWTLIGAGCAPAASSHRPMIDVIPDGVEWVREAAAGIDPETSTVTTTSGRTLSYDQLVVCPGLQLDWDRIPGMAEALLTDSVSSNYRFDLTAKTWSAIQALKGGTAVFTMPSAPIKCAGAPQKIAYLAADYWRQQGVLDDIRVVLVLPTPSMFGVPVFAKELARVAKGYGIEVRTSSEAVEIDAATRQVVIADNANGERETIGYDFMHVVPPQSAPDWIKNSPLADPDNPGGYVDVDKHTMQHRRYPQIFALGDAGSTPNSKTGAAVRKQAPVVVANMLAARDGKDLPGSYGGYASCPLTTARNKMLLAEFDYTMEPTPSFKVIDTTKERRDMWYLKRYALPALYWSVMLKGRG